MGVAQAELNRARTGLERSVKDAAGYSNLQALVVGGDRAEITKFVKLHPNSSLRVDSREYGTRPPVAISRAADIKRGDRVLATVTVSKPLTAGYLSGILAAAGTTDVRLVVVERDHIVVGAPARARLASPLADPSEVTIGGADFRALAARADPGLSVVALSPMEPIDDTVTQTWWRALWAALATLGTVALLAYLVAPLVAGRRWTRRLLPSELEEQFAVEGDGQEPFSPPVPSHGSPPATRPAGSPTETATQEAQFRVVLIDADPLERALVADVLGAEHIDVASTGDAEQALRLLGAGQTDLAILDWTMSGRSGAEILAELNIRHPEVPVLIVADALEAQQRHVANLLGAEDFLLRPLDRATVVSKTQQLLDVQRDGDEGAPEREEES